MAFSSLIALSIHHHCGGGRCTPRQDRHRDLAQAAEALRPIAGAFAELHLRRRHHRHRSVGDPVLAGSAAYAIGGAALAVGLAASRAKRRRSTWCSRCRPASASC